MANFKRAKDFLINLDLTGQTCEVELHEQPSPSVGVSRADPDNHRVTVADVSCCRDPPGVRAISAALGAAAVVDGNSDGQTVIQSGDRDLGAVFCAKLHGGHLSGDSVVGDVVEGKGVGIHLGEEGEKTIRSPPRPGG